MIVCKFGGSVIKNKESVDLIKKIINSNSDRKVIVLSAIGKCSNNDKKLTDLLFDAYYHRFSNDFNSYFIKIEKKIINFCNSLKLNYKNYINFFKFRREFYDKNLEYVVSRGEYYTAKIIASYLNIIFLPCEKFLFGDNQGTIDLTKSKLHLKNYLSNAPCIIPGFYYTDYNKNICLFNRGGGDVTGAVIANILNAHLYENYTNVNGILKVSPNLVKNGKTINTISYYQSYVCTVMGASVFSSNAIKYLNDKKIKTVITNANNLNGKSTIICENGAFYYLTKSNNFSEFKNYKIMKKQALLQEFFNVFMLDKTALKQVIYYNRKVYYQTTYNIKNNNCICLTTFNISPSIKSINALCKKHKITLLNKKTHKQFKRNTFYFIGEYNKYFIYELLKILKA